MARKRPIAGSPLARVIGALEALYGRPKPPAVTDPFEQVLFEDVAYLASNERRARAWKRFKTEVGTKPAQILKAARSKLMQIGRAGIVPAITAEKLRKIAEIAVEEFGGDLKPIRKQPLKDAKKALQKFPSIGEPGAEKILLFAGSHPVLALDSNGLRVLRRLGFGKEDRNYTKSYRSVQEALAPGLPVDTAFLIEAHQLLRRHGQQLCKTNHPLCEACPLKAAPLRKVCNRGQAIPPQGDEQDGASGRRSCIGGEVPSWRSQEGPRKSRTGGAGKLRSLLLAARARLAPTSER